MLLNGQQKEFVDKIVYEKKSFNTVSKEMGIPINKIYEWYDELYEEISRLNTEQTLNILEKYDLSELSHIEHLGKLYQKLRDEMENRDFSGLPTDKLYTLLMDVRHNIDVALNKVDDEDDDPWFNEDIDLLDDE